MRNARRRRRPFLSVRDTSPEIRNHPGSRGWGGGRGRLPYDRGAEQRQQSMVGLPQYLPLLLGEVEVVEDFVRRFP